MLSEVTQLYETGKFPMAAVCVLPKYLGKYKNFQAREEESYQLPEFLLCARPVSLSSSAQVSAHFLSTTPTFLSSYGSVVSLVQILMFAVRGPTSCEYQDFPGPLPLSVTVICFGVWTFTDS